MTRINGEISGLEQVEADGFSSMDGEVLPFVAVNASQNIGPVNEREAFASASGQDKYAVFDELPSFKEEYSELFGLGGGKLRAKMAANKARRHARQDQRQANRNAKAMAKAQEISSRANLNNSLTTEKQSDVLTAQAINKIAGQQDVQAPENGSDKDKKKTKTIIIVGASLAVAVVVGIIIYKKMHK